MHFRKMLNSKHLAADDFVDKDYSPIERTLIIAGVSMEQVPTGKQTRACFRFNDVQKTAFLANGEIRKIAACLQKTDTDDWIGAALTITSVPRKYAGQDTTGMSITKINGKPALPGNCREITSKGRPMQTRDDVGDDGEGSIQVSESTHRLGLEIKDLGIPRDMFTEWAMELGMLDVNDLRLLSDADAKSLLADTKKTAQRFGAWVDNKACT